MSLNDGKNNRIYISDLDGTLLRDDATLSSFSRDKLAELIEGGVNFTIASARSFSSLGTIVGEVPFRMPIIEINGAFITDYHTGEHLVINRIDDEIVERIFSCVREHGLQPFVSTFNGSADCLYFEKLINGGMEWYHGDRVANRDKRLRRVGDLTGVFGEKVISMNVMGKHDDVKCVAEVIEREVGDRLENFLFENPYSPGWWWLTIHDRKACKSIAIRELMELEGFGAGDLTVFGDNLNDVKMFQMAGRAIAVGNATDEIKGYADEIIGPNEVDSVVKYILKETGVGGA